MFMILYGGLIIISTLPTIIHSSSNSNFMLFLYLIICSKFVKEKQLKEQDYKAPFQKTNSPNLFYSEISY